MLASSITPPCSKRATPPSSRAHPEWKQVAGAAASDLYAFEDSSTYIQEPPFFTTMGLRPDAVAPIRDARVLALLGDSVTTDHISPAGDIPPRVRRASTCAATASARST